MTEIERLTELIMNTPKIPVMMNGRAQGRTYQTARNIADHLLANGVIVPPCKVEDKLYYITPVKTIEECIVHAVECEENKITVKCHLWRKEREALLHKHLVYFNITDFGKTVFLTRDEAEKALEGMQ